MTRCVILVQKDTLRRAFSGLLQTSQPPKGKECEILNLELGKVGRKAAGHKLRGKIRIVGNFNTERLCICQFHLRQAPPPPPPPALQGYCGAFARLVSPRGLGHLQILHCPGAGHLPTPGPFPSF